MRIVRRVLSIALICVGALALFVWLTREGTTPQFTDAQGAPLAGSVAEMRWLNLGGVDQSVVIRGRRKSAPILVWIHGGPGFPETGMFRRHNASLEDHFVVVYWTQRGAGRSYSPSIQASSMTLQRFVADLDELIGYVHSRFGRRPVVLVGHSWGTSIGVAYAQRHPKKVAAYVGVGQVVNTQEGDQGAYAALIPPLWAKPDQCAVSMA